MRRFPSVCGFCVGDFESFKDVDGYFMYDNTNFCCDYDGGFDFQSLSC